MAKGKRNRGGPRQRRAVNGLLLLDKPCGLTSNEALQRVKRLYQARKAGHTGSLDPLASGMLPICLGQATKLSAYLLGADKIYRVTASWGTQTDTADADGAVVAESSVKTVAQDRLESAMTGFRGQIEQIPPMFSALKKDGRRLYELAREGKEVPREARRISIHAFELESYDPQNPVFRIHCSKGTYVRTLIEDLARAVDTLGHVSALRRLAVLPFHEEGMITMGALEAASQPTPEALDAFLLPVDEAISDWPAVDLNGTEAYYLLQGHPVSSGRLPAPGLVRLYDESQRFLGVGEVLGDGRVAPKRLFVERQSGRAN